MSNLTENQYTLLYWIEERESIRLRKLLGWKKPWSEDSIFHTTYFTNMNREQDKVTKWIRKNWKYKGDYKKCYTFAMIVSRIFNLPSTLEAIGQPSLRNKIADLVGWLYRGRANCEELIWDDKKIWNGAYIISTNGKKIPKIDYCFDIFNKMIYSPNVYGADLKDTHELLMEFEGLASFLAAQVVADLKNTKGHPLQKAEDWFTFSAPGPGSLRGLSWFWEKKISPNDYQEAISEAAKIIFPLLSEEISDQLCMQNFQNCFCEYDKYMRIKNGTGRSKRKYQGV
jgi:hypothetical protein